jgi:hypothetical protein
MKGREGEEGGKEAKERDWEGRIGEREGGGRDN